MDYIKITEWERFQHYKKRNPPWVKLYASFLDDDDFDIMPDASKLLFFCLLSFASRRSNKIKLDFRWLQRKLPVTKPITVKTLQPLLDAGFVARYQDASGLLAGDKHDAILSKDKEEKRREELKSKVKVLEFSLTIDFFKHLFNESFKPETQYEINTFNKLAKKCFEYAKANDLPNHGKYLIDIIADTKEHCKVNSKNRTDLIKMSTAKINKEMGNF
jgi:DNA-binding MarR family transcriptional regulator